MKTARKMILLIGLSLVLGIAIFLSFYRFFADGLPEYAQNLAAAFLGAVITIIVTAVLLQAQSQSELSKEKSIGVFSVKVDLYNRFLEFLNSSTQDGIIDDEEMQEFRAWAFRLALVSGSLTTNTIEDFILQTIVAKNFLWAKMTTDQKTVWQEWWNERYPEMEVCDVEDGEEFFTSVGDIVMALKIDLGEEDISDEGEAAMNRGMIDEIILHL